jgi:hypothetical protein
VQVFPPLGQVHPGPAIVTSVKPAGTVSVTVTVPLVGPGEAPLLTVTVYVAASCPGAKLPECVFETLRLAQVLMTMFRISLAALVSETNRGTGIVSEAYAPRLALKAGGVGAKLRFTVAVPGGGEFWPGFAVYVV